MGWITFILGLYFLVKVIVLNQPMSAYPTLLCSLGFTLIVLFGEQGRGTFLQGLFRGLVTIPANILAGVGSFSDVVSYIRLFAVGIATKEVAVAFNQLALNNESDHFFSLIGTILILLFGHTINLLLAAMSVLVHGIRLNFLECSRHLSMEWSGIPYRPFHLPEVGQTSFKRRKI